MPPPPPLVQSRAVRNAVPNFVWSLKRYDPVHHHLNKDSLVNHFVKASSFTTKVRDYQYTGSLFTAMCTCIHIIIYCACTMHNNTACIIIGEVNSKLMHTALLLLPT